jgi:starch-binding outer membrane protein, SusD/RagB family
LVSFQRTVDLKRYALDNGKPWSKQTIEHKIGDKTYSKSINDAIYQSLPIDNAIIEYNPQWGLSTNETTFAPYNAW